jgi:hypothetical protein
MSPLLIFEKLMTHSVPLECLISKGFDQFRCDIIFSRLSNTALHTDAAKSAAPVSFSRYAAGKKWMILRR